MLFLGTSQSNAQEQQQPLILPTVSACGLKEDITLNLKEKHGEVPMLRFKGGVLKLLRGFVEVDIIFYSNIETETYTIVADIILDNKACILVGGKGFEAIVQGEPT